MSYPAQELATLTLDPGAGRRIDLGNIVLTLKIQGAQTGGSWAAMEVRLAPGAGSGWHRHGRESESFLVTEGAFHFRLDDRDFTAEPGAFVSIPAGARHRFHNAGESEARALIVVAPAGLDAYFLELTEILQSGESAPAGVAELNARYGLEFLPDPA